VSWLAFPPLPGDPGHPLWARDFAPCGTVLSFSLRSPSWAAVRRVADALTVFRIGASFGGVHSLVAPFQGAGERSHPRFAELGPFLRLSIGLEHAEDLRADLEQALAQGLE
jgi:cystathionine beta-lyase